MSFYNVESYSAHSFQEIYSTLLYWHKYFMPQTRTLCSMCQVFCAVGSDQQLLHHHILTKDVLLAYNIH